MKVICAIKRFVCEPDLRVEHLVILLTGLWLFLIPFGNGEYGPGIALAVLGLYQLIRTRGTCVASPAAKSFLLLLEVYLIPVVISLTDTISFAAPLTVLLTGLLSGLAGLAIISAATASRKVLLSVSLLFAAVVGFWFLDAGIQAVFGKDIFGLQWEAHRLSGMFSEKTKMGYYAGPFSAFLLIFALQKKWKPVWLFPLFLFTSIIVLLNNHRGGWAMYGIVAAVFCTKAFVLPRKHKVLTCAGLLLAGAALICGLYHTSDTFRKRADQTLRSRHATRVEINKALSNRLSVWEAAVGIIKDHPINGIGANNYRLLCTQYWSGDLKKNINWAPHPHQLVLEYAVGTGTIGVLGLFFSMGLCLHWWHKASSEQRTAAFSYGLVLLALYFPLNTHRAVFSSELSVTLWMLIALYTAALHTTTPVISEPEAGA